MRTNKINFLRVLSVTTIMLLVLGIAACNEETSPTGSTSVDDLNGTLAKGKNPVIHQVSLGGADLCEAFGLPTGCDANFSLTANKRADGSVSGQWQDTFSGGGEGIHVAIDCMVVDGNTAIVSGLITHGTSGGVDVSGQRAVTALVDNGTSQKDSKDQMSFSYFPEPDDCNDYTIGDFTLLDITNGQVKIK